MNVIWYPPIDAVSGSIHAPVQDAAALAAITDYLDKMICLAEDVGLFAFDAESVAAAVVGEVIVPDNITPPAPGRWIKVSGASASGGHLYDGIYVAADTGNDANTGGIADPVQTLQAAWNAATDDSLIILMEAGNYGGLTVTAANKRTGVSVIDATGAQSAHIDRTITVAAGVYAAGDEFLWFFGVYSILDAADSTVFDLGDNDVWVEFHNSRISAYAGVQSFISSGTIRLYLQKGFIIAKQQGAGTISTLSSYDGGITIDGGVICGGAVITDTDIETSVAVADPAFVATGYAYLTRSKVLAAGWVPGAVVTGGILDSTNSIFSSKYSVFSSLVLHGLHDFSDSASVIRTDLAGTPGALGAIAVDAYGFLAHDGTEWEKFDRSIGDYTQDPVGILDTTESELVFTDGGTGSVTIQPLAPATSFGTVQGGIVRRYNAAQTVNLDGSEGKHWVYFDADGVIQHTTVEPEYYLPFVAVGYWNADTSSFMREANERHSVTPWAVHEYLHHTIGTKVSGFELSVLSSSNGALDTDAQVLIGNGTITDEDLSYAISDGSPQDMSPIAQLPVLYRSGATGVWRKLAADDYPFITAVKAGSGTRVHYNYWDGATWDFAETSSGQHTAVFVIADNDINEPLYVVPAQSAGSLSSMESLQWTDLSIESNALAEFCLIYKVIIKTANAYANTPKAYIHSVIDYRKSGVTNATALNVTDHNSLNDREVLGAHPSRAVAYIYTPVADVDYIIAADDNGIVYESLTAPRAVTPPDASAFPGRRITIKDLSGNAGTHNITVTPTTGTIDGAANFVISTGYASYAFVAYDGNWIVE